MFTSPIPFARHVGAAFIAWGLALVGPGCDGDDASSTTDAATSGATETADGSTTGANSSTTDGTAETTNTTTEDESTAGFATTGGTTTGFGSSGSSSGTSTFGSTGSTGGLGPYGYGPCEDLIFCALEGEACTSNKTSQVCGYSECETVDDCPLPDPAQDGTAEVACRDISGLPTPECLLDCSSGQACPTGMNCANDDYCAWPL